MNIDPICLRLAESGPSALAVDRDVFSIAPCEGVKVSEEEEFFERDNQGFQAVSVDKGGTIVTSRTSAEASGGPIFHVVGIRRALIVDREDSSGSGRPLALDSWLLGEVVDSGVVVFPASEAPAWRRAGVRCTVARGVAVAMVMMTTGLGSGPAFAGEGSSQAQQSSTQVNQDDAPPPPPPGAPEPANEASEAPETPAEPTWGSMTGQDSSEAATVPAPAPGGEVGASPTLMVDDATLRGLLQKQVMVATASTAQTGILVGFDPQQVMLSGPDGAVVAIPRAQVTTLQPLAAGSSTDGRKQRAGGITMITVGSLFLVGGAAYAAYASFSGYSYFWGPMLAVGAGTIIGGAFLLKKGKKMRDGLALSPSSGPRLSLAPIVTKRRVGGGLSLRF